MYFKPVGFGEWIWNTYSGPPEISEIFFFIELALFSSGLYQMLVKRFDCSIVSALHIPSIQNAMGSTELTIASWFHFARMRLWEVLFSALSLSLEVRVSTVWTRQRTWRRTVCYLVMCISVASPLLWYPDKRQVWKERDFWLIVSEGIQV